MPTRTPIFSFMLLLTFTYFSLPPATHAQEPAPFVCGDTPPKADADSAHACAILPIYGEVDGTSSVAIEFAGINGNSCTPVLRSAVVDESARQVTIELVREVPPQLGCLTVISPYTVQTQQLSLTKGDWDIVVVKSDGTQTVTYTSQLSLFTHALFLPLLTTP